MTAPADTRISDERLEELIALHLGTVSDDGRDVERALTELRERRAQAVRVKPDGWVTVPRDPTPEMLRAAHASTRSDDFFEAIGIFWRDMVAAAPPPAQEAGVAEALEEAHWDGMDELRRAQEAQAVAWGSPGLSRPLAAVSLERYQGFNIPLYASPPPAQSAGVAEAAKALLAAIDASDLDIKRHTYPSVVERAADLRAALSVQDREE